MVIKWQIERALIQGKASDSIPLTCSKQKRARELSCCMLLPSSSFIQPIEIKLTPQPVFPEKSRFTFWPPAKVYPLTGEETL